MHQKCQVKDCQNKDRLSVRRQLILVREPTLNHTKHLAWLHVAHRSLLDITTLTSQTLTPKPCVYRRDSTGLMQYCHGHVVAMHCMAAEMVKVPYAR